MILLFAVNDSYPVQNLHRQEAFVRIDVKEMSERLAYDPAFSSYDFWRACKRLDDELYQLSRSNAPIPIDLIFGRAIIQRAAQLRQ
jgi:hypothetical protein